MKFAEQLKTYRKNLGYTKEEMAVFLGDISIQAYRAWEQGTRSPLKLYQKMIIERIKKKAEEKSPGE